MTARATTGPTKKDRYHHGDLRRALIDAALALTAEQGVDGLTLRAAARRVGVTHSAPYRHFEDKSALVAAVAEEGFRLMAERMLEARERASDVSFARLQAIGVSYVEFAVERPAHFRVMFGLKPSQVARYPDLALSSSRAFMLLVDGIQACQADGSVVDGEPHQKAIVAWSLVHGLSSLLVEGLLPGANREAVRLMAQVATENLYRGMERRANDEG